MVRISVLIALSIGLLSSAAYPYAIMHGKDSAIPAINIYVFTKPNGFKNYLISRGIPDIVMDVAQKAAGIAVPVGAALAVPTEGISIVVASGIVTGVGAAKAINEVLKKTPYPDEFYRWKLIDAFHKNVPRGNRGRGAEWNWASIQEQTGLERGASMYVVVTDPVSNLPLYQGKVATDGRLGIIIKKVYDPSTKKDIYMGEESQKAADEYVPAK